MGATRGWCPTDTRRACAPVGLPQVKQPVAHCCHPVDLLQPCYKATDQTHSKRSGLAELCFCITMLCKTSVHHTDAKSATASSHLVASTQASPVLVQLTPLCHRSAHQTGAAPPRLLPPAPAGAASAAPAPPPCSAWLLAPPLQTPVPAVAAPRRRRRQRRWAAARACCAALEAWWLLCCTHGLCGWRIARVLSLQP